MMNNQDSILLNDDGWVSVQDVGNLPPINQDILVWLTSEKPNRGDSVHGIATDRYFDDDEYKGFGFECRNNLRDNKVYVTHWHSHPINNNLITLYRAMCQEEYNSVSSDTPFVWHSKAKWFSDDFTFIHERVLDGKFNNSNHKPKRYTHLVGYEVENLNGFSRVSSSELMLKRKDVPLTSVKKVIKLGAVA